MACHHSHPDHQRGRCGGRFLKFAILGVAGVAAFGAVVQSLWNSLVPSIFPGLHEIGYLQALGLLLLSRLLVGGLRGPGGCRHRGHGCCSQEGQGCHGGRCAKPAPTSPLSDSERQQLGAGPNA